MGVWICGCLSRSAAFTIQRTRRLFILFPAVISRLKCFSCEFQVMRGYAVHHLTTPCVFQARLANPFIGKVYWIVDHSGNGIGDDLQGGVACNFVDPEPRKSTKPT